MSQSEQVTDPAFWGDLKIRGIIFQQTAENLGAWLAKELAEGRPVLAYCGFDPTASSLHIGGLLPILGLRRLKNAGIKPVALVGGATGMIGDPSGKSQERVLQTQEDVERNVAGIRGQLERLLDGEAGKDFLLVNNGDWFKSITFIDFLRDVGKHFSVNVMMAKESVRARLEDRESGISYTEFSYMLLQAYDYLHLFEKLGCRLQCGGSDQWGNITAGIDLIHHKHHDAVVHGCTFPLLTNSAGQKFGKSERGAIWIDPKRTHPYFLYKYFFDTQDADVVRFLNLFTFLSREEIDALALELQNAPQERRGQKALAREVTGIVHGANIAEACEGLESSMHRDDIEAFERHADSLGLLDPANIPADVDPTALPVLHRSAKDLDGAGMSAIDLAVETGLYQSKSEVRREIQSGAGLRIAGNAITDATTMITRDILGGRRVIQIRRGKKNKRMLVFSD